MVGFATAVTHRYRTLLSRVVDLSDDEEVMSANRAGRLASAVVGLVAVAAVTGCGVEDEPEARRQVVRNCPSVIPGSNNATQDFAALLVWDGRTYVEDSALPSAQAQRGPLEAGPSVGTVTCSLVDPPGH